MFFDGFEENSIDFLASFWGIPNVGTPQLFSSAAGEVHQTAGGNGGQYSCAPEGSQLLTPLIATDHIWIHIWFNPTAMGPHFAFIQCYKNSNPCFTVSWSNISTTIRLRRGGVSGTLVAESAVGTFDSTVISHWWIRAEIKNAGGTVTVHKGNDAASLVTFAGDTTAESTDDWEQLYIDTDGGSRVWFDDVVILTGAEKTARYTAGTASPQVELYVWKVLPSADNAVQLTPTGAASNWQAAATRPFNTGIYNLGVTTGLQDTYTFTAPVFTINSIGGVKSVVYSGRQGAIYDINGVVISGATTSHGITYQMVATGSESRNYAAREAIDPVDPNTGALWVYADYLSAKFGVRYP